MVTKLLPFSFHDRRDYIISDIIRLMRQLPFILAGILLLIIGVGLGWIVKENQTNIPVVEKIVDRSLDKYSIENLKKTGSQILSATFSVDKILKENANFTSSEFTMEFNPNLDGKTMKKVTGMINVPKKLPINGAPVVVMIRGFIDPKNYFIGNGTQHAGEVFARNGYITIAPDFLGYGDSDLESTNVWETRFQTWITVTSLLSTVKSLPEWDKKNIFIWAHSNGGQIALTTLEITGVDYPTTLWAPVSAPFPFSVLYYTDEADDKGKALRKSLASFEETYNTDLYSLDNYFGLINKNTKIQLHQGTADDAVPVVWSNKLKKTLVDLGLDVNYFVHPGATHDMTGAWNEAVTEDLAFFRKNMMK